MNNLLQESAPTKSPSLNRRITFINGCAIGLISILLVIGLLQNRSTTLKAIENDTSSLSRTLAEHTAHTLDAADSTLTIIKKQRERDFKSNPRTSAEIISEIQEYVDEFPQIRGMIITDKSGVIRFTEMEKSIGMNVSDREYFSYLKTTPNARRYISAPLKGRITGNWFFSISRPIDGSDGSFFGVATALITQKYFIDLYNKTEDELNISTAFVSPDGEIFAASDGFTNDNEDAAGKFVDFQSNLKKTDKGTFTGSLFPGGEDHIISYTRVPKLPIYIVTSLPMDKALIGWVEEAIFMVIMVAIAMAVLIFLTYATARLFNKQKRSEKNLIESEERYRDVVNSIADWVWETDANHRFTYLSDRYEHLVGLKPDALIGKRREEISNDDSNDVVWINYDKRIEAHKPIQDFEYSVTMPNGRLFHFRTNGKPRYDAHGAFLGYRGTGSDITDSVEAQRKQRELEDHLHHARKMETLGTLTGGIAHDFNNILSIIIGNLEIISRQLQNKPGILKRVKTAQKGAQRGAILTRSLLGYSRKDSAENSIIDPVNFFKNIVNLMTGSLPSSITIKTMYDSTLWPVEINIGNFEDAILNLAINAKDAMPNGGTLSITASNTVVDENHAQRVPKLEPGDYVQIEMSDTGHGMDDETRKKVFEPFFSTKQRGKGTGLGLSMVYTFIQNSNGTISVTSAPDKGSTFTILLPRTTKTTIQTRSKEPETEMPTGTETILVVDDEKSLAEIAKVYLKSLGYQVTIARNGVEALQVLDKKTDINLLFSDIIMPGGVDGYQLAEQARDILPNIKILLASGYDSDQKSDFENTSPTMQELIKRTLNKPYSKAELAQSIRRALDESIIL